MEDAIIVHFESAHQVRVAPYVHGGLCERQNVIPIHRRNDVLFRGEDDVVRAMVWEDVKRKKERQGKRN